MILDFFRRPPLIVRPDEWRERTRAPWRPASAAVLDPPQALDAAPAGQEGAGTAPDEPLADYAQRAAKAKLGPTVPGRCDGCGGILPEKKPWATGGSARKWCGNACRLASRKAIERSGK